ncbi:MAG: hypothetical protein EBX39_12300, partial [Actinobacteria bacterium]|nr:hypothetical protein [Actinomycetota bacterium]
MSLEPTFSRRSGSVLFRLVPRWMTAIVLVAAVGTHATSIGIAADDHHGGGHHTEIGANPPANVKLSDFESPARFQTDLALWSVAVFGGLLFLLGKFAWGPIMDGLQKREQGIADLIAQTQRSNDEAKRMLVSYERRMAEASEEVRGLL